MTTGYGLAVEAWTAAGWRGVLPLPARSKTPPPSGYTGAGGGWPTPETIAAWVATGAPNACLRLPDGVIGIDIDAYGTHSGAETLGRMEARCGRLPATWTITSRSDGVSGIRLYRAPLGVSWRGDAGPGIDVIQHRHRYCVLPPSIHPEGREYLLIGPGGELLEQAPTIDDLPMLPTAWVDALREPVREPIPEPERQRVGDGPLDRFKARATAGDVRAMLDRLGAHGWRPVGDLWHGTRPGKTKGTSVVVGLGRPGGAGNVAHVHSSNWPGLPSGTYTASDLLVLINGGDARRAAAEVLEAEGWRAPNDTSWLRGESRDDRGEEEARPSEDDDWSPIDLARIARQVVDGTLVLELPTVLAVRGLLPLFYRARVNQIFGESGGGKTWIGLAAVVEVVRAGGKAAIIDYEDRPEGITARLVALGLTVEECARIRYYGPLTGILTGIGRLEAELADVDLIVVDSTGEAMAAGGVKANDDDDVARWVRLAKRLALLPSVPAVLLLDHIPKDKDAPSLYAIGSQRKRAAVTGAAYRVDTLREPAKGKRGALKLVVAKDRLGNRAKGDTAAIVDVDGAQDGSTIRLDFHASDAQEAAAKGERFRPTGYMEEVSKAIEATPNLTKNALYEAVGRRREVVDLAVAVLVEEGFVHVESGARNAQRHTSIRPYREADDDRSRPLPTVPRPFPGNGREPDDCSRGTVPPPYGGGTPGNGRIGDLGSNDHDDRSPGTVGPDEDDEEDPW